MLRCCANFPCIHLPSQELDKHHSNTYPTIFFVFIPWLHSVQCMVDNHWMRIKFVAWVFPIQLLCHLKIYTQWKILLLWRHTVLICVQLIFSFCTAQILYGPCSADESADSHHFPPPATPQEPISPLLIWILLPLLTFSHPHHVWLICTIQTTLVSQFLPLY